MNILLTGATGFIGSHLRPALQAAGHRVVCAGRRPPSDGGEWVPVEFAEALTPAQWQVPLRGIDAVVNAVGILREQGRQRFAALHEQAPCALFRACAERGVTRVVQVSALGVEQQLTPYQRSKHAADACLLGLPLAGVVVQPSLVFGPGGDSARWFLMLASLPLLPLPAGGGQPLQPVHVDDVVQAVCALLQAGRDGAAAAPLRVPLVGPRPTTWHGYLQGLRGALQLAPAPGLPVPAFLVALAARVGDMCRAGFIDSAAWRMLQQGSIASPEPITRLLGRPPRDVQQFLPAGTAPAWRCRAQADWLVPLLRLSLALVWLATAWVSLFVHPWADSLALLARVGVTAGWQPPLLVGAAGLDLLLGVLTLWPPRRRRWLWLTQTLLMLFYMAVIAWRLPEFWSHPYGPLLKNLPMLAILGLLLVMDGGPARAADGRPARAS